MGRLLIVTLGRLVNAAEIIPDCIFRASTFTGNELALRAQGRFILAKLVSALRALDAIGYTGWVTIELYPYIADPDLAASTALDRVKKIMTSL